MTFYDRIKLTYCCLLYISNLSHSLTLSSTSSCLLVAGRVLQTGEGSSTGTLLDVHLTLSNHNVPCTTLQPVS